MALYRLYIVRHGETDWNKEKKIQGHLDTPLNATGLAQAAAVARALKDVNFIKAYTSDLQRASKTAEAILRYHPTVELVQNEALRERYMGELQDQPVGGRTSAPSMETGEALINRCLPWYWHSILEYITSKIKKGEATQGGSRGPQSILVVSHGGLIATLLRSLLAKEVILCARGVEFVYRTPNTGVSVIDFSIQKRGDVRYLIGTLVKSADATHLLGTRRIDDNADQLVQ